MANWKKELKQQLMMMAMNKIVSTAMDFIPNNINLNLDPVRDYLMNYKSSNPQPRLDQIVQVTGRPYRKQVMEFKDPKYNYNQY